MKYRYQDAFGVTFDSMVELSCPTFVGDVAGAAAESKQRIRQLSADLETANQRLDRLEQYNEYLIDQIEKKMTLDAQGLVQWLQAMAALSAANNGETELVATGSRILALPSPVAQLMVEIGQDVTEAYSTVEVRREDGETKETPDQ